ncbi:uncharacterized protein [Littorina saxatilis]|uniref:uncharacterized protein n=1 Tax=Littorina saxatilis TaxID=31220 RepID=UPI0038B60979
MGNSASVPNSKSAPMWFEEARADDSDDGAGEEDGSGPSKRDTEQSEMTIDVDSSVLHFSDEILSAGKPSISVPSTLTVTVPCSSHESKLNPTAFHIVNDHKSSPVFFKVKVTHPGLLTFKPNTGRIEPSGTVIITVSFSPIKQPERAAKQPTKVKAMIQTIMMDYPAGDKLPYTAWSQAPPSIVGQNVMKIDLEDPQEEEEIDSSKFVTADLLTSKSQTERPWWKSN